MRIMSGATEMKCSWSDARTVEVVLLLRAYLLSKRKKKSYAHFASFPWMMVVVSIDL